MLWIEPHLAAAEAEATRLRADNERLVVENERLRAELCSYCRLKIFDADGSWCQCSKDKFDDLQVAATRLAAESAAKDATITAMREAIEKIDVGVVVNCIDQAEASNPGPWAEPHRAALYALEVAATDAGSALLARLEAAEACAKWMEQNGSDGLGPGLVAAWRKERGE